VTAWPSAAVRGLLVVLVLCLGGCAVAAGDPFEAHVTAVVDGDTVRVRDTQGLTHRLRLAGIDAPEKAQPYSRQATQHLHRLLQNQNVVVEPEKTDRYGRTIAKVKLGQVDAGVAQLQAGLAWHYKAYEAEQSPADRLLYAQAEDEARSARRGLWQDPQPVPPWDFRRQRRNANAP
jgi:endonuclease YncB( thermonuclease family)